jgi:hypothetical protein
MSCGLGMSNRLAFALKWDGNGTRMGTDVAQTLEARMCLSRVDSGPASDGSGDA